MDTERRLTMDRIELKHLLPQAFAARDHVESDVWHRDVCLQKGKAYLVEAASGTGKSSLCSYIYGYRADYQGIICFDGSNIRQLPPARWTALWRRSLSLLFQELRLFPELTALENVLLKNRLTGFKKEKDIRAYFGLLGLADKMDTPAARLSYGQQQRVALIRCLCQPFDFLLLDEPVSHLDDDNNRLAAQLVAEEARRQGGAGILVTSIGKTLQLDYDVTLKL